MRRCAFLTLADKGDYVIDDEHTYGPMRELGWQVDAVPWSDPDVDWQNYEVVVIRSPWDYQHRPAAFMEVLGDIEARGVLLANSREIVAWNLQKTYMQDLQERGVAIVPTAWREFLSPGELPALFDELQSDEIVIKPQISANAQGAFWISRSNVADKQAEIEAYFGRRPLLAQPFVRHIADEGEYSLFYFNNQYSHAVIKKPKANDFRCQEEHGGMIRSVTPDAVLRAAGDHAVKAVGETLLYQRADFVRSNIGDNYWMMELELIEPSLYFRTDKAAAVRFAHALNEYAQC